MDESNREHEQLQAAVADEHRKRSGQLVGVRFALSEQRTNLPR